MWAVYVKPGMVVSMTPDGMKFCVCNIHRVFLNVFLHVEEIRSPIAAFMFQIVFVHNKVG